MIFESLARNLRGSKRVQGRDKREEREKKRSQMSALADSHANLPPPSDQYLDYNRT